MATSTIVGIEIFGELKDQTRIFTVKYDEIPPSRLGGYVN